MIKKRCSKCRRNKPATENFFYLNHRRKDGLFGVCIRCHKKATKRWIEVHPQANLVIYNRCLIKYPENMLLRNTRRTAKTRELKYDLTREWIKKKIEKGFCEVTGLSFDFEKSGKKGKTNPFAPSIDRKNPKKGYTKRNCQMVVWIYNQAKNSYKHEMVMVMARALVKKEKQNAK